MAELDFELERTWGGWGAYWVPDDLDIVIRADGEEVKTDASLTSFMEAYGCILNGVERHVVTGSITDVHVGFAEDGRVEFEVPPLDPVTVAPEEIQRRFESLLSEVFEAYDEGEDSERREEALDYIQGKVDEWGVGFDVRGTYRRLS